MQAKDTDEALQAMAEGSSNGSKAKGKTTPKGKIAKVEGMAGTLAEKSAKALNAGIATADRDSLTFAQGYMQRFDANMQAINGKLTDAWSTVGEYAELGEVEELPPFEDQLNNLLAS